MKQMSTIKFPNQTEAYEIVDATARLLIENKSNTEHAHTRSEITDFAHEHDERYYTESEIDEKLSVVNTSITNIISGSTVIKEAEHAISADSASESTHATSATTATKDASGNVITDTYETKEDAQLKYDIIADAKADWNENNESSLSYVKNRTHWVQYAGTILDSEVFECTTLASDSTSYYCAKTGNIGLVNGSEYNVTMNGTVYTATALYAFGGEDVALIAEADKCRIYDRTNGTVEVFTDSSATLTISIATTEDVYVKLDEKFIPDVFARTTDIDGKMEKENPSGTGSLSINRKQGSEIGEHSISIGTDCVASGASSVALGSGTTASGFGSYAIGSGTVASGDMSHASGQDSKATGFAAYATGAGEANGDYAFSSGYSIADGNYSYAAGNGTWAVGRSQTVIGEGNLEDSATDTTTRGTYSFIIGNGDMDAGEYSNAHTVDWNGNAWYAGDVYVGSASGTNKDEGSRKLITEDEAKLYVDTKTSSLASTSVVDTKISAHNTSTSAHGDIRDLISDLTTRLNALANSTDEDLDQMAEIVSYIKSNKSLIDSITTSKINVSDIVDNLTTNVTNKPLSAAQGVAIKALIDALQTAVDGKADSGHSHTITASASDDDVVVLTGTNGTNKVTYSASHANSGVTTGTYKSVTVNAKGHVTAGTNPTTLSGYGITDAYTKTQVDSIASGKANSEHEHEIADVSGLQDALDGKAATSHGTHVSFDSTNKPKMDGTAAFGTSSKVARADHVHPTDTSRASKTEFDSHVADTTKHITSTERTNWEAAYTHSQASHAPSNAQANQNAFSNVKVGTTTIVATTTTDTLELAGSNVTITPDTTDNKVTIAVADGSTSAKGIVKLTNSTSSTSTTTAATPSSVKSAYDLANTAKTNAATAQTKADSAYALAEGKVDSLSDLGITATATELNYTDGVTSNIQSQLDSKSASGHTHNYAGSSSAGGAATSANKVNTNLIVKLNGGTTEGTNMYTFNGSAAKTINITPSAIGASATSHTHDDRYYTETEVDTKLAEKAESVHTHNYAGSETSGGAANSANKLNTNAGSATQPVYFANGIPVAGTYSINKTVPSNAVFTDANVTQTATTTNGAFPILLRSTSAGTSTVTSGTSFASNMTINPSTGELNITKLNLGGASIRFDTTENAFIFDFE